ncbi:protein of unknown function [Taphrina deformans PYCC 5710]|uniref:tRNA-dihydrouridine(47) synthase [NAD(P)(+)] n=1 Tax=Taphrina deformans (strain PYCC 5710 / ATCC 11124 / CBS 356.35 / IMI 108563 / JCM 9778 / NBRC 8474) TaxID=1097556 RepID=R4XM23_TAPDE|nr:protein of unknown function [Taphrina deformans PYCC 5710]|eukprot:CCG84345.1 protein of unknown function [Taphrina deformans PYCC 5710]
MPALLNLPEDQYEDTSDNPNSSALAAQVENSGNATKRKDNPLQAEQVHGPDVGHKKQRKKAHGQNKGRKFTNSWDDVRLCPRIALGQPCDVQNEDCKFEHKVSVYMSKKPTDIGPVCSVYQQSGYCEAGFRCRWLTGHVEKPQEGDPDSWKLTFSKDKVEGQVQNVIKRDIMILLRKKQYKTARSETYLEYLNQLVDHEGRASENMPDVPLRSVEKRRLNWSGAKVLAPLTTTGNLPFRQLCREFGADVTYSEMAVSAPLLSGGTGEWALTRSHASERDFRGGRNGLFGVQLAGPKAQVNLRAAEVLNEQMSSTLDFIDLNCGCPIDLIFKSGAGSALLDNQGRLVKILKGMSMVSGAIPITCKIRTGVSDKKNTAGKLLARLNAEACVSMVTLHGRSRQQRYSRSADWTYIADCATQIKSYQAQLSEEDLRSRHAEFGYDTSMAFLGNGDIYTYEDWNNHMQAGVDGCMIARGALIKPWIFEEITAQQHLDKSASERLAMIQQFCHNGLAYWGADQMGVDKTRRFMLEFMSFHHRYTPVGLLERGPLPMNERAPTVVYRNEQEKLLASESCSDWIKVSELFLGKASDQFKFLPKHKANSIEAEG